MWGLGLGNIKKEPEEEDKSTEKTKKSTQVVNEPKEQQETVGIATTSNTVQQKTPSPQERDVHSVIQPETTIKRKKMDSLRLPEPMSIDGNLCANWKRFKRSFEIYMIAADIERKTDVIKINTFLNALGADAVEIFDLLEMEEDDRKKYDAVIKAFESHCSPQKNQIYERYMFYQRKQREGESFDAFLIDIQKLVKTCEFNDKEKEMLRDRIVMGVFDVKLQARLLEIKDLTYTVAVEKCKLSEVTRDQTASMSKTVTVNEIRSVHSNGTHNRMAKQQKGNSSNNNNKGVKSQQRTDSNNTNAKSNNSHSNKNANNINKNDIVDCKYCGLSHKRRKEECTAYGKVCTTCFKKNHLSNMCRAKNVSMINTELVTNESEFNDNNADFFIDSLGNSTESGQTWIEKIRIEE